MVPTLTWGVNSCHADEACLTWAQLTVMRVSTMTEEQQMFRKELPGIAQKMQLQSAAGGQQNIYIETWAL